MEEFLKRRSMAIGGRANPTTPVHIPPTDGNPQVRKLKLTVMSAFLKSYFLSFQGFVYSVYKSGFLRNHRVEWNWRKGFKDPATQAAATKVLKGHDDHVITCLQFDNDRIVSGSDDNTLKVSRRNLTFKCN